MLKSTLLGALPHGFGTKQDGDGRVREKIKTILHNDGLRYSSIMVPQQCHGTHVEIIKEVSKPVVFIPDCDGLVTCKKEVVLTVLTADCAPILYSDPVAHVIGISHGGWKGTLGNIVSEVILKMEEVGASRKNIRASIGPCIGSCCYEIFGKRKTEFENSFSPAVLRIENGVSYLDLTQANREHLLMTGLFTRHTNIINKCTSCDSDNFYSYHRDKEIKGEMVSYLYMN